MGKKHHFNPQLSLRKFASEESLEYVVSYDMKEGTMRKSKIEDTGCESHLYSITDPEGKRTVEIENLLGKIETKAAPLIDKFLNKDRIEEQEKYDLASFFALAYIRTNAFRQGYAETIMIQNQQMMYAQASNPESFNAMAKVIQDETGITMSDSELHEVKKILLDPKNFNIEVSRENTLKAIGLHDEIAPIFYEMKWSILCVPDTESHLITSDNPLVKYLPSPKNHPGMDGFLNPNIEVTLPLSKSHCWLGHWNNSHSDIISLNKQQVKDLNKLRAIHATRFLYASKEDVGILSLAKKYYNTKRKIISVGFGPKSYSKVIVRRKLD